MTDINRAFDCAHEAAMKAGELIVSLRAGGNLEIKEKSPRNFLSSADLASEKLILDILKRGLPESIFLSEESHPSQNPELLSKAVWIVDPIDGTTNYLYGIPHVGVSIALAVNGEVVLGIVHAPFLNETYSAIKGRGAFCNARRINANKIQTLGEALVATGFPYERDAVPELTSRVSSILSHCRDIRRFGAASLDLCAVACGRIDAYYETVQPWDMAAGALIAREAGAVKGHSSHAAEFSAWPQDLNGNSLLVTAPGIFHQLKELIQWGGGQ